MTALALVGSALVVYTVILLLADSWRRTGARLDRGMAALGHTHRWVAVPGSARDVCPCGAVQVRRWTT